MSIKNSVPNMVIVEVDYPWLMFSLGSSHRYYLYGVHCDMRKKFDGLCGLASSGLGRSMTGGDGRGHGGGKE